MHIPDGYLGPITCVAGYAAMVPVWAISARKVNRSLEARQVPLLAIGAAFSFVIMMFNIPIPGGTTGHAVGGALAAILLGPWAACLSLTVALVIQALLFGDGGLSAFGANSFIMAFVMPFVAYGVYRMAAGKSPVDSRRRMIAAGIAGYISLVAASACAGVLFGIQPLLHTTATGQTLYCPYGLKIALPTMVGEHVLVFGWIELFVTALAIKFLQHQEPELLQAHGGTNRMKTTTKLWIALGVLAILSPLGLYLPIIANAGPAWGEWGNEEIKQIIGYVPAGMAKLSDLWKAPFPDYAHKGMEQAGIGRLSLTYFISAIIGIGFCAAAAYLLAKTLSQRGRAGGFAEKTIAAAISFLKETVSNDATAGKDGLLQQLDPRAKCASLALILAAVLITKSIILLGALCFGCVGIAMLSRISVWFFLKRTLLFVPLFSFCIVIPALFNVVTPGEPVLTFSAFPFDLSITKQGVSSATIFFLRVFVSVSLAALLVLTTRHHALLKALRIFHVPKVFVMTISMTYRYIFLLLDAVQNTLTAAKSRAGFFVSSRTGRRIVAANAAGLWLRSYRLQSQVYDAMLSRGYTGESMVLDDFHARKRDASVLIFSFLILAGTLCLNHFFF